jgi:hypothetical protein
VGAQRLARAQTTATDSAARSARWTRPRGRAVSVADLAMPGVQRSFVPPPLMGGRPASSLVGRGPGGAALIYSYPMTCKPPVWIFGVCGIVVMADWHFASASARPGRSTNSSIISVLEALIQYLSTVACMVRSMRCVLFALMDSW